MKRFTSGILSGFLPITLIWLVFNTISGQSSGYCPMGVSLEPRMKQITLRPGKITQSKYTYLAKWNEASKASGSDDQRSSVTLSGFKHSSHLLMSEFGANIPAGATIHGIEVWLEGQSTQYTSLAELSVTLKSAQSSIISQNKANTSHLQKPWRALPWQTDHNWCYGSKWDTWGIPWDPEWINARDFVLEIQIRNATNQEITAYLDDIRVIVHYTPLYVVCPDSCVVFYVDPFKKGSRYQWYLPQNFIAKSREDQHTINVMPMNAPFGTYEICADILNGQGLLIETCCRKFNYQDCASNIIQGVAFEDTQLNKRKDAGDPLLSGVAISLRNQQGQIISTIQTDATGKYIFNNIPSGSYYLLAAKPAGKLYVLNDASVPANVNSDFSDAYGQGSTNLITVTNGQTADNIDFGFVNAVSLGDFVWHDMNYNGIQDISEPGIRNVVVHLLDAVQNIVSSTTSDASGKYVFTDIYPGNYSVLFQIPDTYFGTCRKPDSGVNSDIDEAGQTSLYSFTPGVLVDSIDAGLVRFGSLTGILFEDLKFDGNLDVQDPGIGNVEVRLSGNTYCGEQVFDTVFTDSAGFYHFTGVKPGNYDLHFQLGSSLYPTGVVGQDITSNKMNADKTILHIMVGSGSQIMGQHAGVYRLGTLSGTVWNDQNANSFFEDSESFLSGVTVFLQGTNGQGNTVDKMTSTDQSGRYRFSDLAPGDYRIYIQIDPDYGFSPSYIDADTTRDNNAENGVILGIELCSGQSISHMGFAVFKYASIGDRVWHDINGNGIYEDGEPGISGIQVDLIGSDNFGNQVSGTIVTNQNGLYRYQGLSPGTYQLKLSQTDNYFSAPYKKGNNDVLDNDFNELFETTNFIVAAGENKLTIDAGLFRFGNIQGMVWEDLACDGIFDIIDQRLESVEITIEGITNGGTQVQKNTMSAFDGTYIFEDLAPGQYLVTVTLAHDFQSQNPVKSGILTQSGEIISDINFPLFRFGSIGDFVWFDGNGDGVQDADEFGLDGMTITLIGTSGGDSIQQVIQSESGFYTFENLKPGEYTLHFSGFSDVVPTLFRSANFEQDSDIDETGKTPVIVVLSGSRITDIDAGFTESANGEIGDFVWVDANGNGIQDDTESGLAHVEVRLSGTDNAGNMIHSSAYTDESGNYLFTNVKAGNYTITFTLPEGYYFTNLGQGNGSNDSKADTGTGVVASFDLVAGESNRNIDAGVFQYVVVGDFVWFDSNEDGIQDSQESGVEGIEISVFEAQFQALAGSTLTDTSGFYQVSGLKPGSYYVVANIPADKLPTLAGAGDSLSDSDFFDEGGVMKTSIFTLFSGDVNNAVDLGLIDKRTEISGIAWRDLNANGLIELNEPRYNKWRILLIDASGDTISIAETDSTGRYLFENILPGLYRVVFPVFDSLTFTKFYQGSDPASDSDVLDVLGGIVLLNVSGGDRKTGINAGYITKSSIGDFVWLDSDEDGLQDSNEAGLNGIRVYLYNLSNVVLDSTITSVKPGNGISGYYEFANIFPGDYYIRFQLPNNLLFTGHVETFPDINSDVQGIFGLGTTDIIVVGFQEYRTDIDAGLILDENAEGEINGVVWQDVNASGLRDFDDILLEGVEVKLHALDGTEIDITFTDSNGRYRFDNVFFGSYYLSVADAINRVFVLYTGMNTDIDSEITNEFGPGTSRIISLFPGEMLFNLDFGYAPKISLGDFVWEDLNNDGLQNAGEPGIAGMNIQLLNRFGVVIATMQTNALGYYVFDNLAAGNYGLRILLNGSYIMATPNIGSQDLNSKADLSGVIANQNFFTEGAYTNLDFGMMRPAVIGSRLWLDLNSDGIFTQNEPGIQDVPVYLYTDTGVLVNTTRTGTIAGSDFVGYYEFRGVRPGNYYVQFGINDQYLLSSPFIGSPDTDSDITGDFGRGTTPVFSIAAGEMKKNIDGAAYLPACIGDLVWNDINQNGNQDEGEPGIKGILVSLYLSTGQLLDTVRTDANGIYKFYNLRSRLYYLRFELKDGFEFTLSYNGNSSTTDSDADATGTTPLISLAHGSLFLDVDAGMFASQNRVVMGLIWDDVNKNGLKEPNESVLNQVKVNLTNGKGDIMKSFQTNHSGMYAHVIKVPGTYYVNVEEKLHHRISHRAAHTYFICNDINPNGMSDSIRFEQAPKLLHKNGGMYYHPTTFVSGRIWQDMDNDNQLNENADMFRENVVVLLFTQQNIFVKSTKTDASGYYLLSGIDPGQYYVKIPYYEGFDFILQNESPDSHITNERGLGSTSRIMPGLQNPFIHFNLGYRKTPGLLEQPENSFGNKEEPYRFILFPNPTIYNVKIQLPDDCETASFVMFNPNGVIVKSGKLTSKTSEIDLTDSPAGMYWVEVEIGNNKYRQRFYRMENY